MDPNLGYIFSAGATPESQPDLGAKESRWNGGTVKRSSEQEFMHYLMAPEQSKRTVPATVPTCSAIS